MELVIHFFLFQIFGNEISGEDITIVLAVLAIAVAIMLGRPDAKSWKYEKKKDELKQKELFKNSGWINVSQLNYSTLDLIRDMKDEQNPSYQIGVSESIKTILDNRKQNENQNHILLVGPSLSGKTHITVSVLKGLQDAYVLIPDESTFNQAGKESYELPNAPENAQYKIILLDNFHEFFKGGAVTPKALIYKTIDKGFTLWANCISIEEYTRVKSFLDFKDGSLGFFQEIKMDKKLSISEAEMIAKSIGIERLPAFFNGLMGEFYYSPTDMIQHYEDIKSDAVAMDVLIFIKQAYMLGSFTLPYLMKLDLIKKAFAKKYANDFITLMITLKKIEQKGFIKLLIDHTFLSFDSVWLNEIVEPEMKVKEFFPFWNDIIPKSVVHYTNLMTSSKDYADALTYYIEMKLEGIVPGIRPNTILISKSPNYETALEWFGKIEAGQANVFTYNSLISKSPNYETALEWFGKIEAGQANVFTYSSLISKSPNYDTALEWFGKIEAGQADVFTYSSLIRKSPNYDTALEWFGKIEAGQANVVTYNSLISKSPNYETALEWFGKIEAGQANVFTYNSLISKSPNYETALAWFGKIEAGQADVFTYNSLIRKSPNYETALVWFDKIEAGQANMFTYSSLISKSPNYETALEWFGKIEAGQANVFTYNSLISKSPNFEQGFKLLEVMITKKDKMEKWIKPNERTRKTIEGKTYGNADLLNKIDAWFFEYTQKMLES